MQETVAWKPLLERFAWDPGFAASCRARGRDRISLVHICLRTLAANSRALTLGHLELLKPRLIAELWKCIVLLGRDSLELWLLFMNVAHHNMVSISPQYRCLVDLRFLADIPKLLSGIMTCAYPRSMAQQLLFTGPTKLESSVLLSLTSFSNVKSLDFRECIWPLELDEIDRVMRILLHGMRGGAFQAVECVRFPQQGPMYLKTALRVKWPENVRFIQCPVKPLDADTNWRRVPIRLFENESCSAPSIEFVVRTRSSAQQPTKYTKGCYRRNR